MHQIVELFCARSSVRFIKGFCLAAPQELVKRKNTALSGGCFPAYLDVLTIWVEEERIIDFNPQDTCVWRGNEDADSTAVLVLCATGSELGYVSSHLP